MSKYLQFRVPDYDLSNASNPTSDTASPLTYLRLGAATESTDYSWSGDDLVAGTDQLFSYAFVDDLRESGGRAKPKTYYSDDGSGASADTAAGLTAELMTRGGVREHTDGNRISTTRGDCVEVVGGNYKLVILGRVTGDYVNNSDKDSWAQCSFWESSGGHNFTGSSRWGKGGLSSITWAEDVEDGTWQVTEKTERGELHTTYQGRTEDLFYGPSMESHTGQGGTDGTDPVEPDITERTYAHHQTSVTHAASIEDTTNVEGAFDSKTDIGDGGSSTEVVSAGTLKELTGEIGKEIVVFNESLHANTIDNTTKFGNRHLNSVGLFTLGISLVGTTFNRFGPEAPYSGDPKVAIGVNLSMSLTIDVSATMSFFMGGGLAVNMGNDIKVWIGQEVKVRIGGKLDCSLSDIGNALMRREEGLQHFKAQLSRSKLKACILG